MRFKRLLLIGMVLGTGPLAVAQKATKTAQQLVADKIEDTPVKSGLSYEGLTQFFQSTLSTGSNGGFDFKTSIYGINQLFSKDAKLNLSSYYTAHKLERNLEFSLGAHKSKGSELSAVILGFKYAVINLRSKSDHNFLANKDFKEALEKRTTLLNNAVQAAQAKINAIADPVARKKAQTEFDAELDKYHNARSYKNLPQRIKDELAADANATTEFLDPTTKYKEIAKRVDMGSLLTLSFNPGYNYQKKYFDTTSVTAAYLKGFGNIHKPFNIDLKIQGVLAHDTMGSAHNFSRQMINWTAGLNKVFVNDDKSNPIIEMEVQAEDDWITSAQLYKKEERHKFTANAVFRFHLSNSITLPVTLKYDLKKANVFSIFRLQWNLESSKSK